MRQCLLLLALLLLLGSSSSCATSKGQGVNPGVTPRPWKRYYHHVQRKNERQRRRVVQPNITWRGI